ncbi:IS110 family transposase, partial [Ectopseudomonas mendocina]
MKLKRIGVDLVKQVFQVHGVDNNEQVKCRKQIKRNPMLDCFRKRDTSVWGM